MRYAVAYAAVLVTLLILDFAWLGSVGAAQFRRTLGDVMAPDVALAPALIFYLLYAAGIVYFALLPGLEGGAWTVALTRGVLFGFFAYMTYDLTSLAIIRNYTLGLALTDMVWGAVATGAAATAGFFVTQAVMRRFG